MQPTNSTPSILIVDDERDLAEAVGFHLEMEGYRVRIAFDGKAALEILRREPVDFVISDVRMPVMGGMELLVEMRHLPAAPPLVFMTGYSDFSAEAAIQQGAVAVVSKPFEPDQLVALVRQGLEARV